MNLFTNRLLDLENEFIVTREEGWGEGIVREFGIDMYTLLYLKWITRNSLVVQWIRIHLPMQGTRVQSLVGENFTCCGATKL